MRKKVLYENKKNRKFVVLATSLMVAGISGTTIVNAAQQDIELLAPVGYCSKCGSASVTMTTSAGDWIYQGLVDHNGHKDAYYIRYLYRDYRCSNCGYFERVAYGHEPNQVCPNKSIT